jgi:hypothetical protein
MDESSQRPVIILLQGEEQIGLALSDRTETEEEGEIKCKIQNRESPRVSDPRVYSSIVSFNMLSETGFIK